MLKKCETITIIGKLNNIEEIIQKIQTEKLETNEWFVIQSEESKKIKDYYVVKLIKKEKNINVN